MKTSIKNLALAGFALAALSFEQCSQAAVTGQWDFKSGTLAATIGQDLQYLDTPTQTGTQFGLTSALGIPSIDGVATNVMGFPGLYPTDPVGGYYASVGAAPNGGGNFVNKYTVIMDVLYTSIPRATALFVTDLSLANLAPAGPFGEVVLNANGSLGVLGGSSGGSLTPNVWHRVAVTVDTTTGGSGINIYLDGNPVASQAAPGGLDGYFAIANAVNLFNDPNTNSQSGYVASIQFQDVVQPAGYILALGSPVASGVGNGTAPNPYVVSESPVNDLRFPARSTISPQPNIQIVLADGIATVSPSTVVLKLNGVIVPATVNYVAPTTTISYQVANFLASGSSNFVALTYQDSAADNLGAQWAFDVGPYVSLPAGAVQPLGSANTRGFIYRVAQAPSTATLNNNLVRAQQQLDGTLLNTNGLPFFNEADLTQAGVQPDGSYFIDQYDAAGTVAFSTKTPPGYATLPNVTAYAFPGIPGTNASTANFADDVLAYLQLNAGTYVFGVAAGETRVDTPPDNGYQLFCGANPRDLFSTLVGQYSRTAANFTQGANTNTFTFVAPVSGVYPFRLTHWQNNSEADLAWYYVDPVSGTNVLINDPAGSIPAYRVSTIPREPYVAEVYPAPGGQGFASTAPIVVILSDDGLQVGAGSIKLYLNGTQVTPNSIGKTNNLTTVTYNPNALRTTVTNNVTLIYSDNATPTANTFTNNWSFTIVTAAASIPIVTGQWDFAHSNLVATVGNDLQYFDGPGGQTASTVQFGTCSSFGIPTMQANGVDTPVMYVPGFPDNTAILANYGFIMAHGIAPNGGGTKVNQYTIIYDMYYQGNTLPFFQCQNTNMPYGTDGSLFLQGGAIGQGSGGYTMNHGNVGTGWHRIALAVDLSQNLITKWVDGVKAQDWVSSANGLDAARRAWQPTVLLFADRDGSSASQSGDDHTASIYVSSIQVRNGKLGDAQMVLLGGPSAGKVPRTLPAINVSGQWDFNYTNTASGVLEATVGQPLAYFDGPAGQTAAAVVFTNCSSAGIPLINGSNAACLYVPGFPDNTAILANYGFIMAHGIAPNGGGTKVNQYTIIYDMYYQGNTLPFFECQNTNLPYGTDGSLFLQGGAMGQGSGGYTMNNGNVGTGWHRLAFAADLSQNLITKWVDGVKAQDWVSSANSLDAARRAWQPTVLLFADRDGSSASQSGDDHTASIYVKSIQVSNGKASDAQMEAMRGPTYWRMPLAVPTITYSVSGNNLTLSWLGAFNTFVLNSRTSLTSGSWTPVPGVSYGDINTVTLPLPAGPMFFNLISPY